RDGVFGGASLRAKRCPGGYREAPEDVTRLHVESGRADARIDLRFQAHSAANELCGAGGPFVAGARRVPCALFRGHGESGEATVDEQKGRDRVRAEIVR